MKRTIIILLLALVAVGVATAQKKKKERKAPFFRNAIITVEGDTILCDVLNYFDDHYEIDVFDSEQRKRTITVAREYVVSINSSEIVPNDGRREGRSREVKKKDRKKRRSTDTSSGATRQTTPKPVSVPVTAEPVAEESRPVTEATNPWTATPPPANALISRISVTTVSGETITGRMVSISDAFIIEVENPEKEGGVELITIPSEEVLEFRVFKEVPALQQ